MKGEYTQAVMGLKVPLGDSVGRGSLFPLGLTTLWMALVGPHKPTLTLGPQLPGLCNCLVLFHLSQLLATSEKRSADSSGLPDYLYLPLGTSLDLTGSFLPRRLLHLSLGATYTHKQVPKTRRHAGWRNSHTQRRQAC